MNILKHDKNKLHHSIVFQIPKAEVEIEYQKQLQEIADKAKIPGFRPGKIPQTVLNQRYGGAAYSDAVEECVHRNVHQLYIQEKLRPSSQPSPTVTLESADQGKDIQVKVELEILPEIEVGQLNTLKFKVLKPHITDLDVTDVIKQMLQKESMQHVFPVDRASKNGDTVKINFEGQLEGTVRPEMCGENFDLTLGSAVFIPGFEDQLIGLTKGDKKEVALNFPKEYHSEEFAGKSAIFNVTILEVQEVPLLDITDENIKKMGFENTQHLKEIITKNLNNHYEKSAWKKSKREILDIMEEHFHFEIPLGMKQAEFESIWTQFQNQLQQEGASEKLTEEEEFKIKKRYQQIAERRVRLGLVLSKVGEINKIEVKNKEFEAELLYREQTNPARVNNIIQQELKGKRKPLILKQIQSELFEDKVLKFVVSQGQVTEVPTSIEDLNKEPPIDQEFVFEE